MREIVLSDKEFSNVARKIARSRNCPSGTPSIEYFRNKEINITLKSDVAGKRVILLKSLYPDPNQKIIQLLLLNDAIRQNGAKEIINVLPFIPYLRQDRHFPDQPNSSQLLAKTIKLSGASEVITVEFHSKANKKQFKNTAEVPGYDIFFDYLKSKTNDTIILAPDQGAKLNVIKLAKKLGVSCAACIKRRKGLRVTSITFDDKINLKDKHIFIYDDMIDSGQTLLHTIKLLKPKPKSVTVLATHAVMSNPTIARKLKIITTNTIPRKVPLTKVLDISNYIIKALK